VTNEQAVPPGSNPLSRFARTAYGWTPMGSNNAYRAVRNTIAQLRRLLRWILSVPGTAIKPETTDATHDAALEDLSLWLIHTVNLFKPKCGFSTYETA